MQTLDSLLCRALPGCPKFTDSGLCDFCSGGVSMILPTVAGIHSCPVFSRSSLDHRNSQVKELVLQKACASRI